MANEIKITVKKIDTSEVDKVSAASKRAGKEAGAGLERGFKEGEQGAKKALEEVDKQVDKTSKNTKKKGEEAGKKLGEGLHDGVKDTLASGDIKGLLEGQFDKLKEAGGIATAAGVGIGLALLGGIENMFEQKKIGGLLVAQTGATTASAAQLGNTAGQIFTDNFGESLDQVGEAMKAVFQNHLIDVNANQADIKTITESAMTAAQVVGEDVNNIARAAEQLVRTGLANSVSDAMDLITHASQQGLNASEDLLDTVTEYSTKFRDLGLSGQEAFGLIDQAVTAGARDTDTAADALKEFAIRAEDGSATTARGFQEVGLNANQMGQMIASGGASAHKALELTLNGLRSIHDPVLRDQAAVDLFGTKAEDLGDALFAMNLDSASSKFGDFANATKKASDVIGNSAPPLETAWKNLGKGVNNALSWATDLPDSTKAKIAEMKKQVEDAQRPQEEYKQRVQEAADAWEDQGGAIKGVIETLDKFIGKQHEMATGVLDLSAAQISYQKAVDDATDSAKSNGKTLDLNTQKGRDNQTALNDLASAAYNQMEAMEQQGASAQDLAGFMGTARDQFIAVAEKMGLSATQANNLADKLRLIPGDYQARVGVDATQASNSIETIHGKLVNLTSRTWIASVAVTGAGSVGGGRLFAGMAHGGVVGHAAEGGPRSNTIVAGEHGIELIDVAPGSTVHSNPDSMRMLRAASGGGRGDWVFRWEIGAGADGALGSLLQRLLRQGDLQLVAHNGDAQYVVTGA